MTSPDGMENSPGGLFDHPDGLMYSDSFNDISIDINDILAILDEEPAQGNFAATAQCFQHGEPAPSQSDFEHKPQAESAMDPEAFTERGHSQWNVESSDSQREREFGFPYKSTLNLNDITDTAGPYTWQHVDSNNFYPVSAQNSSNGLRLSCPNNNYPMHAFVDSSGSSLTGNIGQPEFQTSMQEYSPPKRSMKRDSLVSFPIAADHGFFIHDDEEDREHHKLKTSVHTGFDEQNGNHSLHTRTPQNGETGSSQDPLLENFDLNVGLDDSINSSAFRESTVEDGNMYSPSMYMTTDSAVPYIIKRELETFEASNATYDRSNSCMTLPMHTTSDHGFGLPQLVSDPFQQGYSCDVKLHTEEDSPMHTTSDHGIGLPQLVSDPFQQGYSCDVKLHTEEDSPDSSLDDASVTDLDSPLPDDLCSEDNYSEDASLMSETSTDSSPITSSRNSTAEHVNVGFVNTPKRLVSGSEASWRSKPKTFLEDERVDQLRQPVHKLKDSSMSQKNPMRSSINLEDDTDICILDDISDPPRPPIVPLRAKLQPLSQRFEFNSRYHGIGGMGLRPDDERQTFRLAMQDLSQPKTEVSPPDGVLAVPLLRHQRIALSWMVQKETACLKCRGGILADDQGLGKTVSTIALILMERSPSTRSPTTIKKDDEFKALNLEDDDNDAEVIMKQPRHSIPMMLSGPMKKENTVLLVNTRPAAGTLVVCPTSVLRQWADELRAKVTSKANLTFLIYHGSNRTKDANELAKYDVVLTTYAIVSMEVPKQPLVDKDEEEKGNQDALGFSSGLLNCKKRKDPPTYKMTNRKDTNRMDGSLVESSVRPLGRVGWFRVILDEAQSIKNYRTQVARACWGLRAKRRWCLSGTPIQNAIDDLYSYFRFLKFDPYTEYKSFCSAIKAPISRNPTKGYQKLQAVLKTIMLRRTKGTTLDGKPIIILPPKTISLKKVEFSVEERAFYSRLEAESREQFMEYEDAGTVKQNYVNILLMLLRLRQACDHPLLVKGFGSSSSQRSSMEMAKKLPKEKTITLLSYLEVSLAICAICNDPPEDAVVAICGHVFCNQCICEHLTSDENICPSPNCKVQLHAASVFSKDLLKFCLSGELGGDCCSGSSSFENGYTHKTIEDNLPSVSSKIKAALEILHSLPKSQCLSGSNVVTSEGEFSDSSANTGEEHVNLTRRSYKKVSEKAIVFSQWTRMLDLLEGPLKASCTQYRRLDGTMSIAARDKAIKDFKTLPEVTVIIMSLKAASLGLNLVAANHVLLLDLWWNPTTEDQAIDRAHRIGQTRPVTVSRLTINDTVEDRILSLQEKKREMVASAFGEDESGSRQTRLTVDDLRYLFTAE